MMGAGGAMMLWRLAWYRAFPKDRSDPPYTPVIVPYARALTTYKNRGSWRYYQMLDNINTMNRAWPYDGRPTLIWLDGPRHTLNTVLAG